MKTLLQIILIFYMLFSIAFSCTIFCAASDNLVLVGNEEDYYNYPAKIEINPPTANKYGTIYFGFYDSPYIPFGGVNSEGLFFDVAAYENRPAIINQFPTDKYTYTYQSGHSLFVEMLESCSNVEEAIDLLNQYNSIVYSWGHILIADKSGASAVVEWGNGELVIIRNTANYQVATNFNFTDPSWGTYPCYRFDAATQMLIDNPDISVRYFVDILNAVHKSNAIYSNIYDLTNGNIYVFLYHGLENFILLNMNEEFSNGYRRTTLAQLFYEREIHSISQLDISDGQEPKVEFQLSQNYPNPFNPNTNIQYSIPNESMVTIKVFDLLGNQIKTLVNEYKVSGLHNVSWDAKDEFGESVSGGIYLYTIQAGDFIQTNKMVLLK